MKYRWGMPETLILVLGTWLRCLKMGWPLSGDECYTFIWYARYPFLNIIWTYDTPNNHLFHSLLMHLCYLAFGPVPWALRLPVFVAGLASICLVWKLALALTDDRDIAQLAALFMALSGHFVTFSQSGRGYSLATVFALALTYVVLYQNKRWVVAGILGFLCLYTLPSGIIVVLPLYLFALWKNLDEDRFQYAMNLTFGLTALAYAPVMGSFLSFAHGEKTAILQRNLLPFFNELTEQSSAGLMPSLALGLFAAFGLSYMWFHRQWGFFACVLFGYLALALSLHPWFPFLMFYPRNFDILYPYLYILAATGVVLWVEDNWWGTQLLVSALVTTWLVLGVTETVVESVQPTYRTYRVIQDCSKLAHEVAPKLRPGEVLRGNDACDGVALFEYIEFAPKSNVQVPITAVYFLSDSLQGVREFVKPYHRIWHLRALRRHGSAVLYRLS